MSWRCVVVIAGFVRQAERSGGNARSSSPAECKQKSGGWMKGSTGHFMKAAAWMGVAEAAFWDRWEFIAASEETLNWNEYFLSLYLFPEIANPRFLVGLQLGDEPVIESDVWIRFDLILRVLDYVQLSYFPLLLVALKCFCATSRVSDLSVDSTEMRKLHLSLLSLPFVMSLRASIGWYPHRPDKASLLSGKFKGVLDAKLSMSAPLVSRNKKFFIEFFFLLYFFYLVFN